MKIAQKLLWQNAALIFMAWVRIGVSQQCGSRPDVVFREDGDVMVTVLLDLTHGIYCNQTDPNSSKSMHGLLQTLKTLNSIQFLGSSKIGMAVYDTCGQESKALQAVLDAALRLNLTSFSCRTVTHLGFIYSHRSFPALAPLTAALNTPVTDVSQWQSSSPMTAVANLLSSLKWSSVAVVSQSKKLLSSFYRSASNSHVCIVTQTVLSSNIKAKDATARAVRRSRRSGSHVYVLMGSAEFLVNLLSHFHINESDPNIVKHVLIVTDNWNSNLTSEISSDAQEALIVRPQRILSEDNISARVFYSLMKQFKTRLNLECQGVLRECEFEQQHLLKIALEDDDLRILKLSKEMILFNEQFPVTYIRKNGTQVLQSEIGSIFEDKFIPSPDQDVKPQIGSVECTSCLCANFDMETQSVHLRPELIMMIGGGVAIVSVPVIIVLLVFLLRHRHHNTTGDQSGNFSIGLLLSVMSLFITSCLYVLEPGSSLCLTRIVVLSGVYTVFFAVLLSVTSVTLVVHPTTRTAGNVIEILLVLFAVGVQVPVLTYETLFRDETRLTNKILTDYGPKIECTLDHFLFFKLFIYPAILLVMQTAASIIILVNHWKVKSTKIQLAGASLLLVVVNISWSACHFLSGKLWQDFVILAGLQGNGLVIILFVAVPKLLRNRADSHRFLDAAPAAAANAASTSSIDGRHREPTHRHDPVYAVPSHD